MAHPEALDIALALQALYGTRADPDAIGDQAAVRLGELLGTAIRLELPGAPPAGPPGADGEPAWSLDFVHADARGRLLGPGPPPPEAVQAALRVELERLAAYLSLLRSLGSAHDRLEFRLRALHQIARTLTVSRGLQETETLVADYTRELFFAWWVALYRPRGDGTMEARVVHSLRGQSAPPRLRAELLARALPVGTESRAVPVTERPDWLPTEALALAALDTGGVRLGCLMLGDRMNGEPYAADDLQLLATLAHTSAITLRNAELVERLREQAIQDDLTGLYNRRFFDAKLFAEVGRAQRYGRPLSLLLLDLDAFKAYNDEYGHTAGDVLLARIGALVRADIRTSDIGCRYGGEEMAVIAPETSAAEAHRLAERLHGAIGGLQTVGDVRTSVTVSIGIAGFPEHGGDPAQLVEAADRALYRAKAEGRNRIVAA